MVAPMTLLVPVTEDEVDQFSVLFKDLSEYKFYISGTDTTTGINCVRLIRKCISQLQTIGVSQFVN